MIARANTTISILRGETSDYFGDTDASDTAVVTGIQASIVERTRTIFTAATSEPMIVRYIVCRVGHNTDIKVNDRIKDERSGMIYTVDSFSTPDNTFIHADKRIDLKRVT